MRSNMAEVIAPEINQSVSRVYTVITDLDGIIQSVDDALFQALELNREELFNRPFTSFFSEKDFVVPATGLISLFAGTSYFECKTVLHREKKNPLPLKWTVTKMNTRDCDDAVLQWSATETSSKNGHTISAVDVYKSLFDDSPQPMWIYDKATLQFLDVNEAAITHYGYSKKEFLQMTITDIRPESERKKFHGHLYSLKPVKITDKTIWVHQKKNGALMH